MFKELPCRVSCPIRYHGAKIDRKPRDDIVKGKMGICSAE